LGEMAAGFAHEINNPLQIMKSEQTLMDTILSDLKEKGELKESEDLAELEDSMDQIKLQIDRCAKITQAILKFGRQGEPISRDVDLSIFIPEVAAMVDKRATVHGIALKEEIAEGVPSVHGDPGQLQQVLLNLLNNAIDAIIDAHGSKGGELVIQARPDENGKVVISVTDNGAGISPENLKKVFTPFFTTKPVGKGTGLGLSVCYGIVDSMGGVMEVSSQKGVGTTFTVRLPAVA
jgi:two-component system NtrC family sensor kinase